MNPHHEPQNNPYNPLQNQAGPNKYPTLPPMQNPQYPPQQLQYNPQVNPYNPQAHPDGYQPPAQYGNVQAQAGHERERQEIMDKMKENDAGFDSCFLTFYKVWLWLFCVVSFGFFAFLVIVLAIVEDNGNTGDFLVISLILLGWTFIQNVFGLKAISQRSLEKANITCWMMTLGLISSLILEIWLIVVLAEYPYPRPPPYHDWSPIIEFSICVVSAHLLVHIAISMNGAFKVKKILSEREVLQEKLNEIDYSFRA